MADKSGVPKEKQPKKKKKTRFKTINNVCKICFVSEKAAVKKTHENYHRISFTYSRQKYIGKAQVYFR